MGLPDSASVILCMRHVEALANNIERSQERCCQAPSEGVGCRPCRLPDPLTTIRSEGRAITNDSSAPAKDDTLVAHNVHFVLLGKDGVATTPQEPPLLCSASYHSR
jgi:hypothetical protein